VVIQFASGEKRKSNCDLSFQGLGFSVKMEGPVGTICPVEKHCLRWVETYLKDCVCNRHDQVSLTLGLISVCSWGVAEMPQIITNFKEKNTEGVSLIFLMTWVLG